MTTPSPHDIAVRGRRLLRAAKAQGTLAAYLNDALSDALGEDWAAARSYQAVPFEQSLEYLREFEAAHGHVMVPRAYCSADGYPLGRWVDNTRVAHRGQNTKKLSASQVAALQSFAGWDWAPRSTQPSN